MTTSNHSGLFTDGKYGQCERVQSSWPAFRPHSKLSVFNYVLKQLRSEFVNLFISLSRDVINLMFQPLFWCFNEPSSSCFSSPQMLPQTLWSIPHRLIFLSLYLFFPVFVHKQSCSRKHWSPSLPPSTTQSPPVGLSAFITSSPTNRYFLFSASRMKVKHTVFSDGKNRYIVNMDFRVLQ